MFEFLFGEHSIFTHGHQHSFWDRMYNKPGEGNMMIDMNRTRPQYLMKPNADGRVND